MFLPALYDWNFSLAGKLGRGVAVFLRDSAHGHQTVQLSCEVQNLKLNKKNKNKKWKDCFIKHKSRVLDDMVEMEVST